MKRKEFILNSLVAIPAMGISLKNPVKTEPFVVRKGEARFGVHTPFRGINPNDLKVSGKDTQGAISLYEYIGNEKIGPALHIHFDQDEWFFVVNGDYLFQVGDHRHTLNSGDCIFLPRNIAHTWLQLSDTGRLIYWVNPSGKFEEFFQKMSSFTQAPSQKEIDDLHAACRMKIMGPPITL